MSEFGVLEETTRLHDVTGKEKIVVGQVADDASLRLAERVVAVELAMPLAFREVEEAHARVVAERLQGGTRLVLDTVPDDQDFD